MTFKSSLIRGHFTPRSAPSRSRSPRRPGPNRRRSPDRSVPPPCGARHGHPTVGLPLRNLGTEIDPSRPVGAPARFTHPLALACSLERELRRQRPPWPPPCSMANPLQPFPSQTEPSTTFTAPPYYSQARPSYPHLAGARWSRAATAATPTSPRHRRHGPRPPLARPSLDAN